MATHIALISSPEHCEYIKNIVSGISLPYTIHYETYLSTSELPDLFDSIQNKYDAFCTTGTIPRLVIERTHPNCTKPVMAIQESESEFYGILLKLLYKDRNCDFSRILFDQSLWSQEEPLITALDYVAGSREFNKQRFQDELETLTLQELLNAEKIITDRALELQKQNRLDLVITRHSHAYLTLKEAGVSCIFTYPSAVNIEQNLTHLSDALDLIRMGENLPAIIGLASPGSGTDALADVTMEGICLQQCLLDFDQENTAGMLIKKSSYGFELFTTKHNVQRLTKQNTVCALRKYIFSRLGRQMDIGYGIGEDIMAARSHAMEALKLSHKSGQSCLISESGAVTELPDSAAESNEDASDTRLQEMALKTGLSVLTLKRIQSVMGLLGRSELTTQELAGNLQVTVANANRFMNQLQAAGFAAVVGEKKALVRGRPTRIYRIAL